MLTPARTQGFCHRGRATFQSRDESMRLDWTPAGDAFFADRSYRRHEFRATGAVITASAWRPPFLYQSISRTRAISASIPVAPNTSE